MISYNQTRILEKIQVSVSGTGTVPNTSGIQVSDSGSGLK